MLNSSASCACPPHAAVKSGSPQCAAVGAAVASGVGAGVSDDHNLRLAAIARALGVVVQNGSQSTAMSGTATGMKPDGAASPFTMASTSNSMPPSEATMGSNASNASPHFCETRSHAVRVPSLSYQYVALR